MSTKHPGGFDIRWLGTETIEIAWHGYVTPEVVERATLALAHHSRDRAPRFLLHDTLAVADYDSAVRKAGQVLLSQFRARGGERMVVAVESLTIRLLATTVALAARVPVKLYGSRQEAMADLPL